MKKKKTGLSFLLLKGKSTTERKEKLRSQSGGSVFFGSLESCVLHFHPYTTKDCITSLSNDGVLEPLNWQTVLTTVVRISQQKIHVPGISAGQNYFMFGLLNFKGEWVLTAHFHKLECACQNW